MPTVQISARIIRWPDVCACCCRKADTTVEVSNAREIGKKVIHTETKSWKVPYCQQCLAHADVAQELRTFSTHVAHGSHAIAWLGIVVTGFLLVCLFPVSATLAIVLAVLAAAITIGVGSATHDSFQRRYLKEVAAKRKQLERLEEELESLSCPECAELEQLAVAYEGWQGTVHTFWFANTTFAQLFRAANPKKCLEDGQIHH